MGYHEVYQHTYIMSLRRRKKSEKKAERIFEEI